MGSRRRAAPVTSLLHQVLMDHSYGRPAGVAASTARMEEREEGGSARDRRIENNLITKRVKMESEDFEGEVETVEDPVEVFLMVPKKEVDEETVDSEEDMLKENCRDELDCEEEEMKLATLMFRYTSLDCPKDGCQQMFKSKFSLLKHMSSEHGLTVYKCGKRNCDATFPLEGQLSAHRLSHGCQARVRRSHRHTAAAAVQVRHRCMEGGCGAEYASKHQLRDHVKSQHRANQGWGTTTVGGKLIFYSTIISSAKKE